MSLAVVRGATDKLVSSTCLIDLLSKQRTLRGKLFVSFPIIKTGHGPRTIDAVLVSPDRGIVIFDLIEGSSLGDFPQRQDDAANALESRLRLHPELLHRRSLKIEISTLSFAPNLRSEISSDSYIVRTRDSLTQALLSVECPDYSSETYRLALSVLENVSSISNRSIVREATGYNSRGYKLNRLEDSIATLGPRQSTGIVQTVAGVQRIRGLAGSGKTITLALKAAYLHALHPSWTIAVTFATRRLEWQYKSLIQKFMLEQTGSQADWSKLRILHAWGQQAPIHSDRTGIYAQYCEVTDSGYIGYEEARSRFGTGDLFEGACRETLLTTRGAKVDPLYNAILIDEAQDFSASFLRICYRLLDPDRHLTYAYDELQNLNEEALPAPEVIFERAQSESGVIALQNTPSNALRSDIVLPTCYRSSRPILATAHSIGFGIYRRIDDKSSTNLVQMFDSPKLWEDIGYKVKSGVLAEGETVRLCRTEQSSPRLLEGHSGTEDIIQFLAFSSVEEQADWLVRSIAKNLHEDELCPNDILVINPNRFTTRTELGPIRSRLYDMGISSHLTGVESYPSDASRLEESSITFTSVNRAKGREAAMVYVINAHDGISNRRGLSIVRNRLFTAITRSKAWVRVLGIGHDMGLLIKEFEQLRAANFELEFRYPTVAERDQLQILDKDGSTAEEQQMQRRTAKVDEVISDYLEGRLDEASKEKLWQVCSGAK